MRTSDHLLETERRRYKNIPKERISCGHCSLNETENENLFFFNCLLNWNELLIKIGKKTCPELKHFNN